MNSDNQLVAFVRKTKEPSRKRAAQYKNLNIDRLQEQENIINRKSAMGSLQYLRMHPHDKEIEYALSEKIRYGRSTLRKRVASIIIDNLHIPYSCNGDVYAAATTEMWSTDEEEREWLRGNIPTENMLDSFDGNIASTIDINGIADDDADTVADIIIDFINTYNAQNIFTEIIIGTHAYYRQKDGWTGIGANN